MGRLLLSNRMGHTYLLLANYMHDHLHSIQFRVDITYIHTFHTYIGILLCVKMSSALFVCLIVCVKILLIKWQSAGNCILYYSSLRSKDRYKILYSSIFNQCKWFSFHQYLGFCNLHQDLCQSSHVYNMWAIRKNCSPICHQIASNVHIWKHTAITNAKGEWSRINCIENRILSLCVHWWYAHAVNTCCRK